MSPARALVADDEPALVDFLSTFPGERRGPAFWQDRLALWWRRNPAFTGEQPRGWVLHRAGAVVGFLGNVPSRLQLDGKPVVVWNATTWRVREEFRSESLALLFAHAEAARGGVAVYSTPNARARTIMDRLGFTPLPAGDSTTSLLPARPSGPTHAVAAYAARLGIAPSGPPAADAHTVPPGCEAVVLRDADERFDELWRRTRGQFAGTAVRSADAVRWYCFAGAHHRKILLGALRDGVLRGFAVAQRFEDGEVSGLRLRDLWADLSDAAIVDTLCLGVIAEARDAGCELVHVPPLEPRITRRLRRLGAWQGAAPPPAGRLRAPAGLLPAPASLYISENLGDTGL
ncbi:hypothetical protein [Streptomyces griseoruber]|uniref:hypothetical protein n=1 Tax=Streptomyces griseoruber TaxID=1943 RepID=UPI0006E2B7AB|nr:hypothetical protein [Streptomyces griseoruber]